MLGCVNNVPNDRHAEYFDPVLKKFDTTQYNKIDEAFASLDSAFHAFPNPSPGDIYSYDSAKAVRTSFNKNDYLKAIAYTDSMIAISQNKLDDEIYAERYCLALYSRGDYLSHMKKYNEALQYYQHAHETELQYVKDKCKNVRYNGSIGYLMQAQQNYLLAARHYLKQHDDIVASCHSDDYQEMTNTEAAYTNAARNYFSAGMIDSASFYQSKALDIIETNESRFPGNHGNSIYLKAVIYADEAEVLFNRGNYEEAEKLYKKSIEGTRVPDRPYTQLTLARLSEVYLKQGKKEMLKHSLDTLRGETQMMAWLKLKRNYFEQDKQIDSAFFYQQKFGRLRDSAHKSEADFANQDVGKAFENLELKYSNSGLQKVGERKSLYLTLAILIFLMAATIAVLIYYNLQRARSLNMQVEQKNNELQKAFGLLEQSHGENTRIMHVVAHDLKNPISVIGEMMNELLQNQEQGEDREMFEVIQSSCSNSLSLINDLLSDKREQANRSKQLIDIGNLLENCVQLLQAKADEKSQQLRLETQHVDIMIDRQKIWRVMSNLITNAIKFSTNKSLIDIKLQKKSDVVLFSVQDRGIGIPENIKGKIFDTSGETRRLGTNGEEPHGLGLSISKKIITEHGGKLWFESKEGEGSVFYIAIPINTKLFT